MCLIFREGIRIVGGNMEDPYHVAVLLGACMESVELRLPISFQPVVPVRPNLLPDLGFLAIPQIAG